MMIDDDTLKQLLRIDDELMQLCYYQSPGDFDVEVRSHVPLAVRKSLPNESLNH